MGHNLSRQLTAVYALAYTGSLGTVLEELPVASADAVVAATRHEPAGPRGAVCLRALARAGWRACAEFCAAGPRARRRSGAVSGAAQQVAIVNSLGPPVARKQTLATGRRGSAHDIRLLTSVSVCSLNADVQIPWCRRSNKVRSAVPVWRGDSVESFLT
jgi:hypothetical protein